MRTSLALPPRGTGSAVNGFNPGSVQVRPRLSSPTTTNRSAPAAK